MSRFKNLFLAIGVAALLVVIATTPAMCGTTATVGDWQDLGGFKVVTISVVADGAGGAVSAEAIDLSILYSVSASLSSGRGSWYLYYINENPGTGAAEPGAHDVTLNSTKGKVCDWTGATTAALWPDAVDDLPNYWPATEDLTLDVDDIGASNTTAITLWFGR